MLDNNLKNKILSGVLWLSLEKFGNKFLSLGISIVLARLLLPEQFGCIALLEVFIVICATLVDSGFSVALIQKKEVSQTECSSIFFVNIILGFMIYLLLFWLAPFFSNLYRIPNFSIYLRLLALVIIINSFSLIQGVQLQRNMLFNLSFRISLISTFISGTVGIIMAYSEFGVWALISQQILASVISGTLAWIYVKWHPCFVFDWGKIKSLFRFGNKMLLSGLLECTTGNIYTFIIGKFYPLDALAFYNRGNKIPQYGMDIVSGSISTALFPAFSQMQDNKEQMKLLLGKSIKTTMAFIIPGLCALFILAKPFMLFVYGEKWLSSVVFMQISCVYFMIFAISSINLKIVVASGRSDYYLKLSIIKLFQFFVILIVSCRISILAMAFGLVLNVLLGYFENVWCVNRLIKYSLFQQLHDLIPIISLSMLVSIFVYFFITWFDNVIVKLCGGIAVYGSTFLVFALLLGLIPKEILGTLIKKWKQ